MVARLGCRFVKLAPPPSSLPSFSPPPSLGSTSLDQIYLYDDVSEEGEGGAAASSPFSDSNGATAAAAGGDGDGDTVEEYSFVRRRTQVDPATSSPLGSSYGMTTVRRTRGGEIIELKRILRSREYASARKSRDPSRHVVMQRRVSFLYNMQSFNVHMYHAPVGDLCVLHAQVEHPRAANSGGSREGDEKRQPQRPEVHLPPFLDVERRLEDTREDQEKYGAYSISLRDEEEKSGVRGTL